MISIIVPTFNERDNVPVLVERLDKALRSKGYEYEILIVDDGSTDGTQEVVKEVSKKYPVRLIDRSKKKKGLGFAVVDGFKEAKGEILVVMDADLQHPPEDVPRLIEKIEEGCDIVIASRYTKGGSVGKWNPVRLIISKGAALLARVVIPKAREITDPMSGFFALRRDVIEGRLGQLNPLGFKILLEILAKGNYRKMCEIGFVFGKRYAGKSKLGIKVILFYVLHLLRLARETGEFSRMVKFGTVGLGGVLVNEGTVWFVMEELGLKRLGELGLSVSVILGFQTSVAFNFIFHEHWTFKDREVDKSHLSKLKRFIKYEWASVGGLVIQWAAAVTLTYVGIHYLVANLIGIILGMAFRYAYSTVKVW